MITCYSLIMEWREGVRYKRELAGKVLLRTLANAKVGVLGSSVS